MKWTQLCFLCGSGSQQDPGTYLSPAPRLLWEVWVGSQGSEAVTGCLLRRGAQFCHPGLQVEHTTASHATFAVQPATLCLPLPEEQVKRCAPGKYMYLDSCELWPTPTWAPLQHCDAVETTSILLSLIIPTCKMGMRVPTSWGYHKQLLIFDISKCHARLKVNVQNLFFSLSSPFLPFYFPVFYFQVNVAISGHVGPAGTLLTTRASPTSTGIANTYFPLPQNCTTGRIKEGGAIQWHRCLRCHPSPGERSGLSDCLINDGEVPQWCEDMNTN